MSKITIRPSSNQISSHEVFVDGEKVGSFWFDRYRELGTGQIVHSGHFTNLKSGKTTDLSCYAWFADVRREMPYILELTA